MTCVRCNGGGYSYGSVCDSCGGSGIVRERDPGEIKLLIHYANALLSAIYCDKSRDSLGSRTMQAANNLQSLLDKTR